MISFCIVSGSSGGIGCDIPYLLHIFLYDYCYIISSWWWVIGVSTRESSSVDIVLGNSITYGSCGLGFYTFFNEMILVVDIEYTFSISYSWWFWDNFKCSSSYAVIIIGYDWNLGSRSRISLYLGKSVVRIIGEEQIFQVPLLWQKTEREEEKWDLKKSA